MLQASMLWLQSGRLCCLWSSYRSGSPFGPQGGTTIACQLPLKGEKGSSRLWLPPPSFSASLSQVLTHQESLHCLPRLLNMRAACSKGIKGRSLNIVANDTRHQGPFGACQCEPVDGNNHTPWGLANSFTQAYSLMKWTLLIASHCLLRAIDGPMTHEVPGHS